MQTGVSDKSECKLEFFTNLSAKGGYLDVVLANLSAVGLSKWSFDQSECNRFVQLVG